MVFSRLESARRSQRPYRYGLILLCVGAFVNWLGLADNYVEPVRYIGVACIAAGALLICAAMCCWIHKPSSTLDQDEEPDEVYVIEVPYNSNQPSTQPKPPDYNSVVEESPPCYEDALKLNPRLLLPLTNNVEPSRSITPATPPPPYNPNR
uniref:Uncharacterized protein n=3 Tax=Timema TaxID=61471 RepID=A0A7R9ANX6_TIMSH|nr:unnamed protein product [Timema shepardi]CAD7405622.1 unnamed protein product [Timema cristinae]CAD7569876.1 unnamed protein product [Timema californicum]